MCGMVQNKVMCVLVLRVCGCRVAVSFYDEHPLEQFELHVYGTQPNPLHE